MDISETSSHYSLLPDAQIWYDTPGHGGVLLGVSTIVSSSAYKARLTGRPDDSEGMVVVGKGLTREQAVRSLAGETVERLAHYMPRVGSIRHLTPTELQSKNVDFVSPLALFRDRRAFWRGRIRTEDLVATSRFAFTQGSTLLGGRETLIPAGDVYFDGLEETQQLVGYHATTNGAAAHTVPFLAVFNSIMELLERHDMMHVWLCRDSHSSLHNLIRIELLDGNLTLGQVNSITHDLSDYVTTVAFYEGDTEPLFVISAGTALTPQRSLFKAILEIFQATYFLEYYRGRAGIRNLRRQARRAELSPESVVGFKSNSAYYSTTKGFRELGPFLSNLTGHTTAIPSIPRSDLRSFIHETHLRAESESEPSPARLKATLRRLRIDPVIVDISGSFRKSGITVCKAFSLDLLPLSRPAQLPIDHPSLASCRSRSQHMHPFI